MVLRRSAAQASSIMDVGETGAPGEPALNGIRKTQPSTLATIRTGVTGAAAGGAATSGSAAATRVALVTTAVGADCAVRTDGTDVLGAGAAVADESSVLDFAGAEIFTAGRSTAWVLLALDFAEWLVPCPGDSVSDVLVLVCSAAA